MASRDHDRCCSIAITGLIVMLLIPAVVLCACLAIEPEEMPPVTGSSPMEITQTPVKSAVTSENPGSPPRPINITSPRQSRLYSEQAFPPEICRAVSDFSLGRTSDAINGFLRWESVRAKTSPPDAARIRDQIRAIDYAMANTTIQENISVYISVTGEQSKRVRNESVFSENGYIVASIDPTVAYQRLHDSGRDREGYLTLCVADFRKGDRILFVNATNREFLIPHGGIWDVTGEETYDQLEFSADSIPRYDDLILTKVRLIHLKERP